jgi:hypothetical protein
MYGEEGVGGGLCLFVCKNYISLSPICFNVFFVMLNFDEILKKVIFPFGPYLNM